jgi:hypothetical protein
MYNAESIASQLPNIITTIKGLQNRLSQLASEFSPLLLQIEQLLHVLDPLTSVQDELIRTRLSRFFQRSVSRQLAIDHRRARILNERARTIRIKVNSNHRCND